MAASAFVPISGIPHTPSDLAQTPKLPIIEQYIISEFGGRFSHGNETLRGSLGGDRYERAPALFQSAVPMSHTLRL